MNYDFNQKRAIVNISGPLLLIAGPGSGKTATMIERLHHMVTAEKIRPERILVITFSRAAAKEMKERFAKRIFPVENKVLFGTFHSIFLKMIRSYYKERFDLKLCTDQFRNKIVKDLLLENGYDFIIKEFIDEVILDITLFKNSNADITMFRPLSSDMDTFLKIYSGYERMLRKNSFFDFDDIIILMKQFLENDPFICRYWQKCFDFILIDEFQDINEPQFDIVRLLSEIHKNVFAVGDEDQSIYGFRGSRPEIMLDFGRYFNDCKKIQLSNNYRSGQNIVEAAKALISNNKNRYAKTFRAANRFKGEVNLLEFSDKESQNRYMKKILAVQNEETIAVLCRTNALKSEYTHHFTCYSDRVRFLTIHESKGLEFDNVWIPEVMEAYYPYRHKRFGCNEEEERRIFYVGMTRAAKRLYLSYFTKGKRRRLQRSVYLDEICKNDKNSFYVQKLR